MFLKTLHHPLFHKKHGKSKTNHPIIGAPTAKSLGNTIKRDNTKQDDAKSKPKIFHYFIVAIHSV